MQSASFIVRLPDLETGPKRLRAELPPRWLDQILADTDAKARAPGELDIEASLNGREVMVRGNVSAKLTMPCAITLDPVEVDVAAEVFLMLEPRPVPGGAGGKHHRSGASHQRTREGSATGTAGRRPEKRGSSKRSDDASVAGWGDDPELSGDDAARDHYTGDEIALDDYLREFIVLELPLSPRRSDLRSEEDVASALRSAGLGAGGEPPVDPRLAPLAAIAERLRQDKE